MPKSKTTKAPIAPLEGGITAKDLVDIMIAKTQEIESIIVAEGEGQDHENEHIKHAKIHIRRAYVALVRVNDVMMKYSITQE